MTLREVNFIIQGVFDRRERERDERMSLAWHIEALARQKRLPRLESLMSTKNKPTGHRMTPGQIEAITRGWLSGRHRKEGKNNGR